jgi:hypothetical protein
MRCVVVASALVLSPVTGAAAGADSHLIRTSATFQHLGGWKIERDPTLRGAIGALGRPTSCRLLDGPDHAVAVWRPVGVAVELRTYGSLRRGQTGCTAPGSIQVDHVRVTGRSWFTSFGLRVGDSTRRLRHLYPHARRKTLGRVPRAYWLVTRWGACVGLCDARFTTIPVLLAEVRSGKVAAFYLHVGAEGD